MTLPKKIEAHLLTQFGRLIFLCVSQTEMTNGARHRKDSLKIKLIFDKAEEEDPMNLFSATNKALIASSSLCWQQEESEKRYKYDELCHKNEIGVANCQLRRVVFYLVTVTPAIFCDTL